MKNTILLTILAILLALIMIISCGDDDDDDDSVSDDDTADDDDDATDDDDDASDDDDTDDDDDDDDDWIWHLETADDSADDVGSYTAIDVDGDGAAHISYYNVTSQTLKYATNGDKGWSNLTADGSTGVGKYNSIAVDGNGDVHISYWDEANGNLKYANGSGGTWTFEDVDDTGFVIGHTSLALDSDGKVHISYMVDSFDLRYATNASGSWATELVEADAGYSSAIGVDSSGKVHIAGHNDGNTDLKYSTNASGSWVTTAVDTVSGDTAIDGDVELEIDGSDNVHITFHYKITGATWENHLLYAHNKAKAWTVETITSEVDIEVTYGSLALDSAGNAYTCFYYHVVGDYFNSMGYATNTGGPWEVSEIFWLEIAGFYCSIALSEGYPVITFYDQLFGDLIFGWYGPPE